ncbi:MAG TPA: hypothetical protein VGQ83_40630 [Polyangia bacterium]|jgi:hypothetical protein
MSRADRLIERSLGEGLGPEEERELRGLLRADADARARYDGLRAVARVAAGRAPDEATDAELDRLGAALRQRRAAAAAPAQPSLAQRLWPFVAVATAATAVLMLWPRSVHHDGRLTRGGGVAAPALCSVEAYAVAGTPDDAAAPRRLGPGDRLRLSDYLQLRYYSADPEVRWLYVFGLDARMQPLDYYPRPDAAESVPIEPGDPQSMGRSIRLEKRHQPGPLKVIGLCSRVPLHREAVLRGVATMRAAAVGVRAVDHVPVDGVAQTTVLDLEVVP